MWQFCHVVFWDKETVKNNWYCFKPVCSKTVSLFQGITVGVSSCKNPENLLCVVSQMEAGCVMVMEVQCNDRYKAW